MANDQNLKSWKPGQSGNPAGKPKGTKHLSTWIREMMEDENFTLTLENGKKIKELPVRAVVETLITKSLQGDMKAIDLLAKYGYGTKIDLTSQHERLPAPILGGLSVAPLPKDSEDHSHDSHN